MEYESHSLSSDSVDFKLEIVSLVDDSEIEGVSGDYLSNWAPSKDPSEALFSEKAGADESFVEKPPPPSILNEAEIKFSH